MNRPDRELPNSNGGEVSTATSYPLVAPPEVLGRCTENQQWQPLFLAVDNHLLVTFAHRLETPLVLLLVEQLIEPFYFGAF